MLDPFADNSLNHCLKSGVHFMPPALGEFRRLATEADQAPAPACIELWRKVVSLAAEDPAVLREPGSQYILGYGYYHLIDLEPEAPTHSEQSFIAALAQDPNDNYAKLYLGHLAFDSSQYEMALRWFDSIPDQTFTGYGQSWRDLKRQELRICCLVHLGKADSITSEFENYLSLATHCDELDVLAVDELPKLLAALSGFSKNAV